MNMNAWKSKTAYRTYSVFGIIFLLVVVHTELIRRNNNKWSQSVENKTKLLQQLTTEVDRLRQQNQTLNEFVEQTSVRDVIEENKGLQETIETLQQQLFDTKSMEAGLRVQLTQLNQMRMVDEEKVNEKIQDVKALYDQKMEKLNQKIRELEGVVEQYQKHPLFDLNPKHMVNGKDYSYLLLRLRFLKYLCDVVPGDMDTKKVNYKMLLDQLKEVFPKDAYMANLKPVKIPRDSSFLARYVGAKKKALQAQVAESNQHLSAQLQGIYDYIVSKYRV